MTDRQIDRDELADAPVWPYILWLFAALIGFGVLWVFFGEAVGDGAVGIAGIVATPTLAAGVAADRFVADRFRVPNPGERRRLIWWSFAVLGVPFLLDWAYRFVVLVAADKEVPMPVYEGISCVAAFVAVWLVYTYLPAILLRLRVARWARESSD